jgi:S-DNA-T family DNA segregation ATPase FtsK/SpoIIIE
MAEKTNSIKEPSENKEAKKSAKTQTPSTAVPERKSKSRFIPAFLKSEAFTRVSGLFLILFSLFLIFAFVSHLFNWQADYDKVKDSLFIDYLADSSLRVNNTMGKAGAWFAYLFFHQWFGIASFLIPFLIFLLGFRLFFSIQLLPFGKVFFYCLLATVFISLSLAFLFADEQQLLGGSFGFFLNQYLISVIGSAGVGILLFFTILSFVIINFNWKPRIPPKPDFKGFQALRNAIPTFRKSEQDQETPETDEDDIDTSEGSLEMEEDENDDLYQQEIPEPVLIKQEKGPVIEFSLGSEEEEDTDEKSSGLELTIQENQPEPVIEEGQLSLSEEDKERMNLSEVLDDEMPAGLEDYDPTLDLSDYKYPTFDLLDNHGGNKVKVDKSELEANSNRIIDTLKNYSIEIAKISASIGPTVTLYEIVPAAGVRISKIKNLEDDIALSLSALGIRIIAPMPGKGTIGIEVPNQHPEVVAMKNLLSHEKFINTGMDLPVALGKTISNENFVADLAKMPHLLMAGATGQGKSVGLNAILVSLLYKKHPSEIKFVLVDPKKVELTLFNKIERHFLAKLPGGEDAIITDTKKVVHTLNSLCILMDERYELLKMAMVRNIKEYNAKFIARKLNPNNGHHFMPYIVLVVDEFADLIMTAGKEVELPIARLAQLARAIGIHLIIATQRPSVNIITGTIKANFPARIAFRVTSKIDSRTILDAGGAEQLIGRGDMLFSTGSDLIRLQCPFVDTPEVDRITEFIGSQRGYPSAFELPEFIDENGDSGDMEDDISERDSMFNKAAEIVVMHQQGSASLLQRKLKLGYNRAGRIIDQLEKAQIIGPFEGSKARKVLIKDALVLEQFLNSGESRNFEP